MIHRPADRRRTAGIRFPCRYLSCIILGCNASIYSPSDALVGGTFVMTRRFWLTSVLVGAVAAAVACSRHSAAPASPSSSAVVASNAGADGSTLKAPAPTLQSPIKGVKLDPRASI